MFQWLLQSQQHLGHEQTPDGSPCPKGQGTAYQEGAFRTGYQFPISHSLPQACTGDRELVIVQSIDLSVSPLARILRHSLCI